MKKNHVIIISLFVILIFFGIKKATYDNEMFLVNLAEFSDIPSTSYYFAVERIFELAQERNIEDKFAKYVLNGEMENLHEEFIHLAGVIGKADSAEFLMTPFIKNQKNTNKKALLYYIVASMGSTGNESFIPLFEAILKNYEQHDLPVPKYHIKRSLYLLTGKNYEEPNSNSNDPIFVVTNELERARFAIEASKGRKRTFEEMLAIDNVGRGPNWRN